MGEPPRVPGAALGAQERKAAKADAKQRSAQRFRDAKAARHNSADVGASRAAAARPAKAAQHGLGREQDGAAALKDGHGPAGQRQQPQQQAQPKDRRYEVPQPKRRRSEEEQRQQDRKNQRTSAKTAKLEAFLGELAVRPQRSLARCMRSAQPPVLMLPPPLPPQQRATRRRFWHRAHALTEVHMLK